MIHSRHAFHGAAVGLALYYTRMADMQTAGLIGGAAAIYMMTYGHNLPF